MSAIQDASQGARTKFVDERLGEQACGPSVVGVTFARTLTWRWWSMEDNVTGDAVFFEVQDKVKGSLCPQPPCRPAPVPQCSRV